MKLKLIAVAMMALLVLTVVPMAAAPASAAKPAPTKLSYEMYFWSVSNPFVTGPQVGKMTFDSSSGHYSFRATSNLAPNTNYLVSTVWHSSSSAFAFGWLPVTTDARGRVSGSGTVQPGQLLEINQILGEGRFFAVETVP